MKKFALLAVSVALLAACGGTRPPAPVVDRSVPTFPREPVVVVPPAQQPPVVVAPQPVIAQPSAPANAGATVPDHVVRRGETMASIARQYNLNPADFARWNNWPFDVPVREGQVLRLTPPPGAQPTVIVGTPLPAQTGPSPGGDVKREPKVVKVPFSDAAFARMQGAPSAAPNEPSKAAAPASVSPISGAQAATLPPAPSAPAAAPAPIAANEADSITWAWPAAGKVTKKFTENSLLRGISIPAKLGTPVYAAASGKVTYTGELRSFGKMVIVRHSEQYTTVYAHLSQSAVKEGDSVRRGQKIAEVGDTDTDEPKLHFEVRRGGRAVDPEKLLPSR